MGEIWSDKVNDILRLEIEGVPNAIVTCEMELEALVALIRHGVDPGKTYSRGVVASIRDVTLKDDSNVYMVGFTLLSFRKISGPEIIEATHRWAKAKIETLRISDDLASESLEYLKYLLTNEINRSKGAVSSSENNVDSPIYLDPDVQEVIYQEVGKKPANVQRYVNQLLPKLFTQVD